MEERSTKKITCHLCGEEVEQTTYYNDGIDYEGHHRGQASSRTVREPHDCDKLKFRAMCMNCGYNQGGSCTNKGSVDDFIASLGNNQPFNVKIDSLVIKNEKSKCKRWTLSHEVIKELFI